MHSRKLKVHSLENVYLGPSAQIDNIDIWKKKFPNLSFNKCSSVKNDICKDLINNRVIGLVRGRMEFGPRALCNRSIIYKTSDKNINDWLNKRMRRTEFMPFAPVTPHEYAKKCYVGWKKDHIASKFMTRTYECKKNFIKEHPAVVHVDGTARPQIISKKDNPSYYKIVKKHI